MSGTRSTHIHLLSLRWFLPYLSAYLALFGSLDLLKFPCSDHNELVSGAPPGHGQAPSLFLPAHCSRPRTVRHSPGVRHSSADDPSAHARACHDRTSADDFIQSGRGQKFRPPLYEDALVAAAPTPFSSTPITSRNLPPKCPTNAQLLAAANSLPQAEAASATFIARLRTAHP